MEISPAVLRDAALRYVQPMMEAKKGAGLIFANCMEKLTMNNSAATLKARLDGLLDAGIDGITLSAGMSHRSPSWQTTPGSRTR